MHIEVYRSNDNIYVAVCPALELFSKGKTEKEAIRKLEDNIDCYLKSAKEVKEDLKDTARFYSLKYPQRH